MFDVALSLEQRAAHENTTLQVHAISRHGLLPHAHRAHTVAPTFAHVPARLHDAACNTARKMLRAIRDEVRRLESQEIDWRDVMASLRPITAMLWQRLSHAEQKRFLQHLRAHWDVHRHRAAPEIAARIDAMIARGTLAPNAARILAFQAVPESTELLVTTRKRGHDALNTIRVGSIINCTGPSSDIDAEPLMRALAHEGIVKRDALNLGITVAEDLRVQDSIYYVGPLLKARDWESTAVPELRVYAEQCATNIVARLANSQPV
jgi:uncharacterized NAD(P)/FAD-binding protein YdhS